MVSHVTGLGPCEFICTLGDYHIYKNYLEQVREVPHHEPLPLLKLEILDKEIGCWVLQGCWEYVSRTFASSDTNLTVRSPRPGVQPQTNPVCVVWSADPWQLIKVNST
jgi:hypothetical protein